MRTLSLAALRVLELAPPARVNCIAEAGLRPVSLRLVPATADEPPWNPVTEALLASPGE